MVASSEIKDAVLEKTSAIVFRGSVPRSHLAQRDMDHESRDCHALDNMGETQARPDGRDPSEDRFRAGHQCVVE